MRHIAVGLFVCAACNAKATASTTTSAASASAPIAASSSSPSSSSASDAVTSASATPQPSAAASASAMASAFAAAPPKLDADAAAIESDHPLARYKTVIHVGDSMVGYNMGIQLELGKMFKAIGVHYEALTVTAAGLRSFATEKHVEKFVKAKNPDLVIVQIGTNNLTVPHPEAYLDSLKTIVGQVGDHACVWIGPIPLEQPEHGMRAMLRDNVAPCVFYDSWDLNLARQSDKIHPTQPASKKWANAFWEWSKASAPAPHSR